MKKLIFLSDLWGDLNNQWLTYYIKPLSKDYKVVYYDVRKLADIDLKINNQSTIHQAFINFGIDRAVEKLLQKENKATTLIGCSIGGVIGWKAILSGLKAANFIGISATRLRYETEIIDSITQLYFGENDKYRPNEDWHQKMNIVPTIIKNQPHEMYRNPDIAQQIITSIH